MEQVKITTQKISPCLWFDHNAEEAVNFYMSVFKDSKILKTVRYGKNAPMPEGSVVTISFQLFGQDFLALNGGPDFAFSEAISFIINCDDQEEIDYFWNKLSSGGIVQQCGWLKDKFGLSWQIVPATLGKLLSSEDSERTGRVMKELFKMVKLDLKTLENAYNMNEKIQSH